MTFKRPHTIVIGTDVQVARERKAEKIKNAFQEQPQQNYTTGVCGICGKNYTGNHTQHTCK